MSPTASEVVPNRALSTTELRTLLERDFARLLSNLSLLQSCAAFGRVSYNIRLQLRTDPSGLTPPTEIYLNSQRQPSSIIMGEDTARPQRVDAPAGYATVEPHPMPQSEVTKTLTRELERNVTSPNRERLREGMPVPVEVANRDGGTRTEQIAYEPDANMAEDIVERES